MQARLIAYAACLAAAVLLLNGCLPGIMISRPEPTAQGQSVEFRLGNAVEIGEWVSFQKRVCGDLGEATAGFPEDVRRDIYRYSCVEPNRHALGETLAKLQPGQLDDLCARLSAKGYVVTKDRIPKPAGELGTAFLVLIGAMAVVVGIAGGM
ncbi:MAG: hypothetical protein HPY67_04425 [Syntrophaceae bacterium]|nr:hypothetical protein [Syntrophaceae bacterium]